MKHFSWLNKKGTTETCCDMGLCMTKDQDERIKLLQKIANDKDKEEKIEELEEGNEKNKEKKVNDLATLKAKLHDLEERMKDVDDKELDDLLESVKDQIEELEKLNPDTDEEPKKSKSAMGEYIGIDNYHSAGIDGDDATESLVALQSQRHRKKKLKHSQSYNVLTLTDSNYSVNGDELFIKQGSVD